MDLNLIAVIVGIVSAVSSNVKFDTYIYMPKLEYAYTNEQVFNMLTNNGAIKGMYMESNPFPLFEPPSFNVPPCA